MGAPASRVAEISRLWVEDGHDVTVLTGFPNHPTGVVPLEYRRKFCRLVARESYHGVNVVRTWLLPLPNRKAYERMLNYSSFFISSAFAGMFLRKPDMVIATSPQLLVGLSGWWLARLNGVPFVFEVRDLWPESLAAVAGGRGKGGGVKLANSPAEAESVARKAHELDPANPTATAAIAVLAETVGNDASGTVRMRAADALAQMGPDAKSVRPALKAALTDPRMAQRPEVLAKITEVCNKLK